jgi:anti-sigma regulatory factor (Ser/Thr protein kinase)
MFNADIETVSQMMDFVSAQVDDFPEKTAFNIKLCCEEILVNIASYAYPNGDGKLAIVWEDDAENRKVRIEFEDTGIPFNPLVKEDPVLKVPIQERKIGGLGIMMVKKQMDTVEYAYTEGKNILTITKGY